MEKQSFENRERFLLSGRKELHKTTVFATCGVLSYVSRTVILENSSHTNGCNWYWPGEVVRAMKTIERSHEENGVFPNHQFKTLDNAHRIQLSNRSKK